MRFFVQKIIRYLPYWILLALITMISFLVYHKFPWSTQLDRELLDKFGSIYYLKGRGGSTLRGSRNFLKIYESNPIYYGDQVLTGPDSHMMILAHHSNDRFELGERTSIRISKTKEDIRFFYYMGEFYISSHGEKKDIRYEVNLGESYLEIWNADVLIRGKVGGKLQVEVYRGQVQLKLFEKELSVETDEVIKYSKGQWNLEQKDIHIITPKAYDRVYYKYNRSRPTRFSWSGIKDAEEVQLYIGRKSESLKLFPISHIDINNSEFAAYIPNGNYYWQLKLVTQYREFYSWIYKIFVSEELPVQLIEPRNNKIVNFYKGTDKIRFRWENPSRLDRLVLEISQTKDFKNIILNELVEREGIVFYEFPWRGTFYWRVNGYRFDTSEIVLGQPEKFRVQDISFSILSVLPNHEDVLSFDEIRKGKISLRWNDKLAFKRYAVLLKGPDGYNKRFYTHFSALFLPALKTGEYSWQVVSYDINDNANISKKFKFRVKDLEKIIWKGFDENLKENKILISPQKVKKIIQWYRGPKETDFYIFEFLESDKIEEVKKIKTKNPYVVFSEDINGFYKIRVKAYSLSGDLIAFSEETKVQLIH